METLLRYRGRVVTRADVRFIRELLVAHPGESRRRLSQKLCEVWGWRQDNGAPREMVARGLMLELSRAGHIELPAVKMRPPNPLAVRVRPTALTAVDRTPIASSLRELGLLEFRQVRRTADERCFNGLLEPSLSGLHSAGRRTTEVHGVRRPPAGGAVCVEFGGATFGAA